MRQKNVAIATTYINRESEVKKRQISSKKKLLTKPSIYESYSSVY